MDQYYSFWEENSILSQIEKFKKVLQEPKDPAQFNSIMHQYNQLISDGYEQGAILMGYCRGKISEGLDFSDNAARTVIVVGIPYAQLNEPRLVLK